MTISYLTMVEGSPVPRLSPRMTQLSAVPGERYGATVVPLGGGTTVLGMDTTGSSVTMNTTLPDCGMMGAMGWIMPVIGIALLLLLVLGIACLVKYLLSSK